MLCIATPPSSLFSASYVLCCVVLELWVRWWQKQSDANPLNLLDESWLSTNLGLKTNLQHDTRKCTTFYITITFPPLLNDYRQHFTFSLRFSFPQCHLAEHPLLRWRTWIGPPESKSLFQEIGRAWSEKRFWQGKVIIATLSSFLQSSNTHLS